MFEADQGTTSPSPRIAIVTGYFDEDRRVLERCLASVRRQTMAADHLLIADGQPQDWLDAAGVRHIKLDRSHADYGGTPRGVGSLLAIAEDYDAIGFVDADNWLEPNHVEAALTAAAARGPSCDYIVARRNMMRLDETVLDVGDEPIDSHVDTNCFLFLPGAYHALQTFSLIPRQLSAIGDRLFYATLRGQNLVYAVVSTKTVNYQCLWASVYLAAGEQPPPNAKPNISQGPIMTWFAGLTPQKKELVRRRTGLTLSVA